MSIIRYYEMGPVTSGPKNGVRVAAADSSGNIVHYYVGYVSHQFNDVKLYPSQSVKGVYHAAVKRTIPLDALLPLERLRIA